MITLLRNTTVAGMRHLHLLSDNGEISDEILRQYGVPIPEGVKRWQDKELKHLHHAVAEWSTRLITAGIGEWKRKVAFWDFVGYEDPKQAILDAGHFFKMTTQLEPLYAWTQYIPNGMVEGDEVEEMMLIQSEYIPIYCLAVGR